LHPAAARLVRQDRDIVMEKHYYSSFTATALHPLLQHLGITTLLVCGVTTNNCVTATVIDAFHLGYQVIVSQDGTAPFHLEGQTKAVEKLRPYCHAILPPETTLSSVLTKDSTQKNMPPSDKTRSKKSRGPLSFDGTEVLTGLGSGDSLIIPSFLPAHQADEILQTLLPNEESAGELEWTQLQHVNHGSKFPRLTAYQSSRNENGHLPAYRCADPQPWSGQYDTQEWTPTIRHLKELVEQTICHGFNWSRILCYRDEKDGMGFHSDKCLDLRHQSFIASVSLGATRHYELKPKKGLGNALVPQRIALRHNTLLLLGPQTNQNFTHSIKKGNGADRSGQARISVTFRDLATWYVDSEPFPVFYGQGTQFATFAELTQSLARDSMLQKLSLGFLGLTGFGAASLSPSLRWSKSSPWMRLGLASVAMAAGSWMMSYWSHRAWERQQDLLGRVYRLCNIWPLDAWEARDLALNQQLLALKEGSCDEANFHTTSVCARDG